MPWNLQKLRSKGRSADFRLLLVNADAVGKKYRPRLQPGETLGLVDIHTGQVRFIDG